MLSNFKFNTDGDKSNKKEKKLDVNVRIKMAMQEFHTKKEGNKNNKKVNLKQQKV